MPTDLAILVILLLSAIVSYVRGFFKEAVSLATWMIAIGITVLFTNRFASLLPRDSVESPEARLGISAIILFIGALFVGNLISWLVRKAMESTIGGSKDRFFGMFFGLARGLIIVTIGVLIANLAPTVKTEPWWTQSALLPAFQIAARYTHSKMPDELGQHFDFSAPGL